MIIVDTALQRREREGRSIRVGLVGAGFMARGVAPQITTAVPGMRVKTGPPGRLHELWTCREFANGPRAGFAPHRSCRGLQAQASDFQRHAVHIRRCRVAAERLCDRLWREQLARFFPDYSKPRNEATP